MGIGVSNLYLVDVDTSGRMDLVHLRQEVQRALNENARPFMVSATAGKYEMITRIQHLINIILHA